LALSLVRTPFETFLLPLSLGLMNPIGRLGVSGARFAQAGDALAHGHENWRSSLLMRRLNGVYTQAFNRRHGKLSHVFQGRFKAILVDRDAYLLAVCRHVELNPVRAGMVRAPGDWPWSSYRAHVGEAEVPPWLHAYLLGHDTASTADRRRVAALYARWVGEGQGQDLWGDGLRQQIYLGDEDFVVRMRALAEPQRAAAVETPRAQRSVPRRPEDWLSECTGRGEALRRACNEGGWSMTALARELGLSVSRISRLIAQAERVQRARSEQTDLRIINREDLAKAGRGGTSGRGSR
jgi:lambda repressor-like predicted transcriptional regulator